MSGVIGGRVGACVFASSDRGAQQAPRVSTSQFLQKRAHRSCQVKSSPQQASQVKSAASGAHLIGFCTVVCCLCTCIDLN
jgi:hypothetical protein